MSSDPIDYKAALNSFEEQLALIEFDFAELEAKRTALKGIVAGLRKLAGVDEDSAESVAIPKNTFKGKTMKEAATEYLRRVREGRTARQIADAILDGGYKTSVKNRSHFANAVRTTMLRDDGFVQVGKVWTLKEWRDADNDEVTMDKVRQLFG